MRVRELLRAGAIGRVTSLQMYVSHPLATGEQATAWRFNPNVSGAGLFLDLASHYFDMVDFLAGPIAEASGFAINTGGAYAAEDVTVSAFRIGDDLVGTGIWNFNAPESIDSITFTGSLGHLKTTLFTDTDVSVKREGRDSIYVFGIRRTYISRWCSKSSTSFAGRGRANRQARAARGRRGSWNSAWGVLRK